MNENFITIHFDKYEALFRDKLIVDSIEEEFEKPQIDVNKIGAILSIRIKGGEK